MITDTLESCMLEHIISRQIVYLLCYHQNMSWCSFALLSPTYSVWSIVTKPNWFLQTSHYSQTHTDLSVKVSSTSTPPPKNTISKDSDQNLHRQSFFHEFQRHLYQGELLPPIHLYFWIIWTFLIVPVLH